MLPFLNLLSFLQAKMEAESIWDPLLQLSKIGKLF